MVMCKDTIRANGYCSRQINKYGKILDRINRDTNPHKRYLCNN